MNCTFCNDTGRLPGSDYLDCGHCGAATERTEMAKAVADFITDRREKLIGTQPSDIQWFLHQRVRQIEREAGTERIAHLENEIERYRRSSFLMSQTVHNIMVGNQAAWIEWQHGKGAEDAMVWIQNGLAGPGLIPDGTEAQAWFDANVDDRLDPPPQEKAPLTRMHVIAAGRRAVDLATEAGMVLTISQVPRLPMAMGNYSTRVEVREKLAREVRP